MITQEMIENLHHELLKKQKWKFINGSGWILKEFNKKNKDYLEKIGIKKSMTYGEAFRNLKVETDGK